MKQRITLFLLVLLFLQIACSSTKTADAADRDGSSSEKAIVAKSIGHEYEWVAKNYPNSQVTQQALVFKGKKPFDVLTVELADGTKKEVYFDISKFFGKGF